MRDCEVAQVLPGIPSSWDQGDVDGLGNAGLCQHVQPDINAEKPLLGIRTEHLEMSGGGRNAIILWQQGGLGNERSLAILFECTVE